MIIPEEFTDFLYWVKETTEAYWCNNQMIGLEPIPIPEWIQGAKWIGLREEEIDAIEKRYDIKFTQHHRAFLKILHTIDRKEPIECYDANDNIFYEKRSFFYNWLEDNQELEYRFAWPYETILDDVLGANQFWLESWGERALFSKEEKCEVLKKWIKKAPKLIPIFWHRFVVSEHIHFDKPVLSVYGADIIVYGWNMRHYLLSELYQYLGLAYIDKSDNSIEQKEELQKIHKLERELAKNKIIPMWEEIIEYYTQ